MNRKLLGSLQIIVLIFLAFVLYFSVILVINTLTDYRPLTGRISIHALQEPLPPVGKKAFSVLSWNIGYAGLGKDADFFYDGGHMVTPPKEQFDEYYRGIMQKLSSFDSVDFILLQEVDTFSTRSYHTNQFVDLERLFASRQGIFIKNYDVAFVPFPLLDPMARVVSGLCSFSSYPAEVADKVVFPGNFPWPERLFMPDRCFLSTWHRLPGGKSLVVINTHNSAFDDGSLRGSQLQRLGEYMQAIYDHGDYVIAGGDWNVNPPGFQIMTYRSGDPSFGIEIPSGRHGFMRPEFVAFDPEYPTNRDVSGPYRPGQTPATTIDFFVCSPNVRILDVKALYNNFEYSDHQPVYLRFELTGND
jgi:endonuclease/exonuclease/phosphatase family metal-dependent hydrolase